MSWCQSIVLATIISSITNLFAQVNDAIWKQATMLEEMYNRTNLVEKRTDHLNVFHTTCLVTSSGYKNQFVLSLSFTENHFTKEPTQDQI